MNCAQNDLTTITSFEDYIEKLRNGTNNTLTIGALRPCRQEICSTIYGAGNADVTGIGVSMRTLKDIDTEVTR